MADANRRTRNGQVAFAGAAVAALALYALTVPDGLPWNASTHLALAYLGEILPLPTMPHPVWGWYVRVFGGSVAMSVSLTALAAGLLAAVVNRYCGWRLAASAAIAWIFMPSVWNRAITGERSACLAAVAVAAAWLGNLVALCIVRRIRAYLAATSGKGVRGHVSDRAVDGEDGRIGRIVGRVTLGAACVFAAVSATFHDYRLGEAASAFARGVVEAAGSRIVVMNGVCDDQIVRATSGRPTVSLRSDDASRTNLVAWAKAAFPAETNLWTAAHMGASAFVDAAVRAHPDRFYLMTGKMTTAESWSKRWEDFKPYLASSDPFVRVARRLFGYEGNAVANAIADGAGAYALYKRVYDETDPGNFSALVNMNELVRRGLPVSGEERKALLSRLETFFKDADRRRNARETARASGPLRADPALLAELETEARRRLAAKAARGKDANVSPELRSLVEWNNEMIKAMNRGERAKAARIARMILSVEKWRGSAPANAVLATVAAAEGDHVAAEAFFKTVLSSTNAVPPVVLNDYADTLMNLGKLAEAESVVRRAVGESEEGFWLARLTLAQALVRRYGRPKRVEVLENGERIERFLQIVESAEKLSEIKALIRSVRKHASGPGRECADRLANDLNLKKE